MIADLAQPNPRFKAAYSVLTKAIADRAFPGCSFGLLERGQVVLADALGRFTYEVDAPWVEATTSFDLASVSKVLATTALTMLLVQRGLLKLDASLAEFFSAQQASPAVRQLTLRQLLAHNSGLPAYVEFFHTLTTAEQVLDSCLQLELESPPGLRYAYSDPGFLLLGKVIEIVAGQPLPLQFEREIARPLGLTTARFCPPAAEWKAIPPTEHDTWFRHQLIQGQVQDENAFLMGGVAGHAGLFANQFDLLRFAKELLAALEPGQYGRLFTRETVELFATRQGPATSSRALGWDAPSRSGSSSGSCFSQRSIGHLGYSGTSLWIDLDANLAIVLLSNRTWPDRKDQQIKVVRPHLHDAIRQVLSGAL